MARRVNGWAHVRRKFHDIHLATGSPLAVEALERIGGIRPVALLKRIGIEQEVTLTQVMQDWLTLGTISLNELTEARILFMDVVIRLVCDRATADDLQALDDNVSRMEELTRLKLVAERIECTADFYKLLASAARNQVVSIMVESLTQILRHFVKLGAHGRTQEDLVASRRQLVAFLRDKDAGAASREIADQLTQLHHLLDNPN